MTVLRLAHRGDWRMAPENTIGAMRAALAIPACDGLEFDVRGSRDGVPVVVHDETLERVQHVGARVDALTAAELAGHGVPTLAELLAAVGPEPFLDVELKGEPVPAVLEVLDDARGTMVPDGAASSGALRRAVVSSFEPGTLGWVGERRPAWRRWLNVVEIGDREIEGAVALGCRGIAAEWRSIDERSARRVALAGLDLAAWTVRRRPTARRLERLGVVAICVEAAALDG